MSPITPVRRNPTFNGQSISANIENFQSFWATSRNPTFNGQSISAHYDVLYKQIGRQAVAIQLSMDKAFLQDSQGYYGSEVVSRNPTFNGQSISARNWVHPSGLCRRGRNPTFNGQSISANVALLATSEFIVAIQLSMDKAFLPM